MPHEVIMPALGMAQDTGLIVSWHKAPGDAVAADDVLFEVETDKSTVEVPAGADGFVSQIHADAGDEVPVGNVIAVIADSADAVADNAPPAEAAPGSAAPEASAPAVEGESVIMPALGMAQDSGVIVAWHKAPGDAVAADDVLFEVETDKATMEVEAGHDGYVAALYAAAGEEAPVGEVIAVISAQKPANPVQRSLGAKPASAAPASAPPAPAPAAAPVEKKPTPAAAKKPVAPARSAPAPKAASVAVEGPILASPKARRLAAEQGLDLGRLAAAGVPMPYHVADLETLRTLPDPTPGTESPVAAPLHVTARVPQKSFAAFADWLGDRASGTAVWASFAAASLRGATGAASLTVRVDQTLPGQAAVYADPDLGPLSEAAAAPPDDAARPDLILRDLTGSRITGGTLGAAEAPALTVAADGADYVLALDFTAGQLEAAAAIALLDGFAGRLEEPLRHLL